MDIWVAFLLNVGLYSILPLYLSTLEMRLRKPAFYCYLSVLLVLGVLAGAIYSFPLSKDLSISGGSVAYGAFMMSIVMLIITERKISTFFNIIRLLITGWLFIGLGINLISWILGSGRALNISQVSPESFHIALWIIVLGGSLALLEVSLLLFTFLQARKLTSTPATLAVIYTLSFFLVLCLDGLLFPLFAFGLNSEFTSIVFGNVLGKAVIAGCYSIPMLMFYWIFRKNFSQFIDAPLDMIDLIRAPRTKLLETLHNYEARAQKLTALAESDALTSLSNRRKFDQTLLTEWSRCTQERSPLTLVIGDIDFFKQYNDTYGHQHGDDCLKTVAACWGKVTNGPTELAARIGGEEFALIFPNTHPDQILARLEQFALNLQAQAIVHETSAVSPHITMSMGVAGCIPDEGSSHEDLFLAADNCLYQAKHKGRNQFIVDQNLVAKA